MVRIRGVDQLVVVVVVVEFVKSRFGAKNPDFWMSCSSELRALDACRDQCVADAMSLRTLWHL